MVRTQIYMTEDQRAEVAAIASQSGQAAERGHSRGRRPLHRAAGAVADARRSSGRRPVSGVTVRIYPTLGALRRGWDRA